MRDRRDRPPPPEPGPGDIYFNEQGLMVFTRQYHLRRGWCCKSGCLHCPWDYAARVAKGDVGSDDAEPTEERSPARASR